MARKLPSLALWIFILSCGPHQATLTIRELSWQELAGEKIADACSARIRVRNKFIYFGPSVACYRAFQDSAVQELLRSASPTCIAEVDPDLGVLLSCDPGLPEPLASSMWVTVNPTEDLQALRILSQRSVGILRERLIRLPWSHEVET